jgi:dUTP pyrophosphatase
MFIGEKLMPKVKFKALETGAILPTYGSNGAIGVDLYVMRNSHGYILFPGERVLVRTGLAVAIPEGYYGRIAPRSGLAHKHGIDVLAGVIDADYRGEIGVILLNTGKEGFALHAGDRIAQLIFECADRLIPEWTDELPETVRGDGGFGSTG